MNSRWVQDTVLRAASLLTPADQRAEWLKGWRSELWYIPRRGATRFSLGAFRDALWLRQNNPGTGKRSGIQVQSPLSCLVLLATAAVISCLIAIRLPGPRSGPWPPRLGVSELPMGCISMLLFTCLLLPATRLAMGRAPANRRRMHWRTRMRGGIFLALKIALVQPVMLCGFLVLLVLGPVAPIVTQLGVFAAWVLLFRWVVLDQRRRCPVCLRLLTPPVRIGNPAGTFLEWYGAESMCPRGHGLLHTSQSLADFCGNGSWLGLDDSWTGLFPESVRVRQR